MDETIKPTRPSLIVVTGRPGAGKSSLVHALARAIRCPAICRDEIKEGLVNTTGITGAAADAAARDVNTAFFAAVELLLTHRITLVAEAAFQHKLWFPNLEPLREIADIRIIVCTVDAERAFARRIERSVSDPERNQFHYDATVQSARQNTVPIAGYEPPNMDVPRLMVDTSDGYRPDFEAIVRFARANHTGRSQKT